MGGSGVGIGGPGSGTGAGGGSTGGNGSGGIGATRVGAIVCALPVATATETIGGPPIRGPGTVSRHRGAG
jgi:hypothetical protein